MYFPGKEMTENKLLEVQNKMQSPNIPSCLVTGHKGPHKNYVKWQRLNVKIS